MLFRLASRWKSLQSDRSSLQEFQAAVDDFLGRLVAIETSLQRLAEETEKTDVVEKRELAQEYLEQFRVSSYHQPASCLSVHISASIYNVDITITLVVLDVIMTDTFFWPCNPAVLSKHS